MELRVRLRNGFSDRNNIKKENITMQITTLDERTRVKLCNFIDYVFNGYIAHFEADQEQILLKNILQNVYVQEITFDCFCNPKEVLETVKETIRHDEYDDVLTIVEFIVKEAKNIIKENMCEDDLHICLNNILEREYVGYRYINDKITPITNDIEIKEIEQASNSEFAKVNEFINKATELLSDRTHPDHKNSIKESISAVEELCNIILGKSGTLGDSLKAFENTGFSIHPALKSAFKNLYGYTSDETGIRHAGRIDGKNATFAEAKFMLVSCSAFVNYLIDNMK